jgi:hypothetical protein
MIINVNVKLVNPRLFSLAVRVFVGRNDIAYGAAAGFSLLRI